MNTFAFLFLSFFALSTTASRRQTSSYCWRVSTTTTTLRQTYNLWLLSYTGGKFCLFSVCLSLCVYTCVVLSELHTWVWKGGRSRQLSHSEPFFIIIFTSKTEAGVYNIKNSTHCMWEKINRFVVNACTFLLQNRGFNGWEIVWSWV